MIMYKKKSIRLLEFYSLLLPVLTLFCFAFVTYADLNDPSLSIYYSFDNVGNKIIEDGSKYKNNGEIVGGAKFSNGKSGKAIALKQDVWIKINGAKFKNLPKDGFTLATWVNHEDSGSPQSLFDAIGDKHGDGLFHVEIRPAGFRFFHRNDAKAQVFNINPGPVIKGKKWHHFAGVYDGKKGKVTIYVDGKKTHDADTAKTPLATNWNVTAGIGHHKNGRWYIGLLDEFFLFARAISEKEVNTIMDGDFVTPVKSLDKLSVTWGKIKESR